MVFRKRHSLGQLNPPATRARRRALIAGLRLNLPATVLPAVLLPALFLLSLGAAAQQTDLAPQSPDQAPQSSEQAPQSPMEITHDPGPAAPPDPTTLVAVHGIVINADTGQPLPRVLVQIGGQSGMGALTDPNGRFDIDAVPPGPNVLQLTRPGFRDAIPALAKLRVELDQPPNRTHSIFAAANTPDLHFAMKPTCAIHGQVELSTGEPAQHIALNLLRRTVQDGRAAWGPASNAHTNADGMYRFAGLDGGDYVLSTDPSMEGDLPDPAIAVGSDTKVQRSGFPITYYPDVREFSSAAHIQLHGGDQAQANIRLALEPFHLIRAQVVGGVPAQQIESLSWTAAVTDLQGHQLPYPATYDSATHTVQAMLPDGTYGLRVSAIPSISGRLNQFLASGQRDPDSKSGQIEFAVAGRSLSRLRVPIAPETSNAIQVNVISGGQQTQPAPRQEPIFVGVTPAGSFADAISLAFAQGNVPGTLPAGDIAPGAYWAHTTVSGLCETSFTAGGANLAREPLIVGAGGATPPLTLNLRRDCASLQLQLPPGLAPLETGEEPSLTAYVVPDFDSTADVPAITLRPSTGTTSTLRSLTPGNYHVYTFPAPVALEYHNPDALASLPSQTVTLDPGSAATLVLEAPAP